MARASTLTKLPLDRWAHLMGISPLHFNQVHVNPLNVCGQPWLQYPWQSADRVGREDVARAIAQAEADIEGYLGYRLTPTWEVDEWRPTIRPHQKMLINLNSKDIRGFSQAAELKWGWFITGGIEAKTLVSAAESVAYTDPDGDGYDEIGTATATVTFTDLCEVAVFFAGKAGQDAWEIHPESIAIAGGVATVTIRKEQLVPPNTWEEVVPSADDPSVRGVDGAVNGNFESTVDFYRRYNDPQQQVTLLWEPFSTCSSCNNAGCPSCSFSVQTGCLMLRGDPRHALPVYNPATWNAVDLDFDSATLQESRQPDMLRFWYYAGMRDRRLTCPTREMSQEWAYTVAVYAASLLERSVCACENTAAFIGRWQQDLAVRGAVGQDISRRNLDNPFGTLRGAVYAWNKVRQAETNKQAVTA